MLHTKYNATSVNLSIILKDMTVYLLLRNIIEYHYGNKHSVVVLFIDLKDSNLSP